MHIPTRYSAGMKRLGRVLSLVLLGLLLTGSAGATEPDRVHLLREQLQRLEALLTRTPAQEQQAEQLRAALRYSVLAEVLSRLGVSFHGGQVECSAGDGSCTVHYLSLSGRATVGEIEAALRTAGYRVLPGGVYIQGPPRIAAASAPGPTQPLKVEPIYRYIQFAGQPLDLRAELHNPSAQPMKAKWGMNVLSAVLLNEKEEVVTWHHLYVIPLVGFGAACPPRQPCQRSPGFSLPLTHYGAATPLPPGHFRLRVRVSGLRVEDGPALSFTLPDLPVTVEAPNAR